LSPTTGFKPPKQNHPATQKMLHRTSSPKLQNKKKSSSPAAGILKPSSIFFSLAASAGAEESWCTDVHSVEPVETAKNDKTWRLEHG